jgi:starch-binding outer membrane protein, SusD/RagB family
MKTIYKYSILLFLMFAAFSCTDLEEEPVGLLAPESMFKTTNDVETAIMGAYGRIASESYFGRKLVLTLQLRSDMSDIGDRGTPSRRQDANDFNMDPENGMVSAFWPRSYEIISAVNAAIDGASRVDASEAKINPLIAEARFVRAFAYYHLVRLFGDIPYIDEFISDPATVKDISKTPASAVYENIIADLEFAKNKLPETQPARSRPTRATAAAYLASVHLTLENWQDAYDNAKWVINKSASWNIELTPDYQDLFRAETQYEIKEPLFVADFKAGITGEGSEGVDWMGPITGIRGATGWSVSVPSMLVYEDWDERDYRKQVAFDDTVILDDGTVYPYTEYQRVQRPHIAKFHRFYGESRGDGGMSDNNYTAMRYAEVLLIAAEALNEVNAGPNTEAEGYVNQIRERARNQAGTINDFPENVPSGLSQGEFRDLVLEERRLELSFEFKRWYDIKRRDMGDDVFKGTDSFEPHEDFDASKHYLLPLPQKDIDLNPNLLPQNPGY